MASFSSSSVAAVIVGGGHIAKSHARYLRQSDGGHLLAIVDPFDSGRQLASSFSVPHFASLDALFASSLPAPALFYVCTPSALHVPVAEEILTKSSAAASPPKAILVEKPLSTDSLSAARLVALAKEKGCRLAVGHHRRFHPRIAAARQVVDSGALGHLTAVSGLWACKKNDAYYTEAPWRASRSKGGGPVWTNLVHDVDVLAYVVGARIVRLWAKSTVRRRPPPSPDVVAPQDLTEEGAALMLEFANGVVGTVLLSDNVASPYTWESSSGENPDIAPNTTDGGLDAWRFFGTDGTLSAPDGVVWTYSQALADQAGKEVGWGVPMTRQVIDIDQGIPLLRQANHMVRVARGEEEPVCPAEDGFAAVQVCEAIVEALDGNKTGPVDIPPMSAQ